MIKKIEILIYRLVILLFVVSLSGCGFFGGLSKPGGSTDSAPNVTLDNRKIINATPKVEARSRGGNFTPYTVLGKTYRVMKTAKGYKERGGASWYGTKFHGRLTSNGERYNMYEMTAAHKSLPIPTYVTVKNLDNGREIIVRVNDRGPFHEGRIIDLSYAAASKIGMLKKGTARVEVKAIDPREWKKTKRARKKAKVAAAKASAAALVAPVAVAATLDTSAGVNTPVIKREYLQVAAFKNLEAAQTLQNQLLDTLQALNEATNVVIHPSDQYVYRVRIGPFGSTAESLLIKNAAGLESFGKMHSVYE
jgi:rare lipoprotein A